MRMTILVVPELVVDSSRESVLRESLPSIAAMAELGTLVRVAATPPTETPEGLYLGMAPTEAQLRQGPLTVSALGADPPERSTHFHLSLVSMSETGMIEPDIVPSPEEFSVLTAAFAKLNTKTLTTLVGEGRDHALVWEGLGDLRTVAPGDAVGQTIRDVLPEGDAEVALRRLIDDSMNLLSDLELNERRLDEGLPPFNMLWPWGHGVRHRVPNLALRHGAPARVESGSLRMAGLSRLVGYRHGNRTTFGSGTRTSLAAIAQSAAHASPTIVLIEAPAQFLATGQEEERLWFARQMDRELVAPLVGSVLRDPGELWLVAPSANHVGLAVKLAHRQQNNNSLPFDERSTEERSLPMRGLPEIVSDALDTYGTVQNL